MNWKVGDRAVCIEKGPYYLEQCTVLSELYPKKYDGKNIKAGELVHLTDLDPSLAGYKKGVVVTPDELRPIDDGKGSWEALKDIFNPTGIEA